MSLRSTAWPSANSLSRKNWSRFRLAARGENGADVSVHWTNMYLVVYRAAVRHRFVCPRFWPRAANLLSGTAPAASRAGSCGRSRSGPSRSARRGRSRREHELEFLWIPPCDTRFPSAAQSLFFSMHTGCEVAAQRGWKPSISQISWRDLPTDVANLLPSGWIDKPESVAPSARSSGTTLRS